MITVFGGPPTRAVRVTWMLEEMGLPYEVRSVDFANRHADVEFMEASPAGAMPAIVDGEVRMLESVAIIEYLAGRYGPTPLAPSPSEPEFPLYQQFLHYGEASLGAPLNVAIASRYFAPEADKANWGAKFAVNMVVARSAVVVAQLQRTPYLAGARFTAADISCGYALGLAGLIGFADRLDPVIVDYLGRLTERPAYLRASAHRAAL